MVTIAFTHEKRENKMKLVDKVGFESIDLLHCGLTVFWIDAMQVTPVRFLGWEDLLEKG